MQKRPWALPRSLGPDASADAQELPRYVDLGGEQLYTVLHIAQRTPRGAVLLCGPFGVERERSYLTLVRWARTLAARGFDVLRFDYRGMGESTGRFEDMNLSRWREDAAACARRLATSTRGVPLVLNGLRMGALIAAELFAEGLGDGMLLWQPPASAGALLRDTLRHNLIAQRMAEPEAPRRRREHLIAALEAGELVNVDGYYWSRALWLDARNRALRVPPPGEPRPWHALQAILGTPPRRPAGALQAELIDADTFWQSSSPALVPHCDGFFEASLRWLDAVSRRRSA